MALSTASNGREGEAAGGAPKLHHQAAFGRRGLFGGLAATSTAITMAVAEPPQWLDRNAYLAILSGLFFAGMTHVTASVWAAGGRRRHGAGRKKLAVMHASLVVAAGLTAAWLFL